MDKEKEFTVPNLIEWLKTMPENKKYDWSSARTCLLGQWCQSKGLKGETLRAMSCVLGREEVFYDIALRESHRCTFGQALQRALSVTSIDRGDK